MKEELRLNFEKRLSDYLNVSFYSTVILTVPLNSSTVVLVVAVLSSTLVYRMNATGVALSFFCMTNYGWLGVGNREGQYLPMLA